MVKSALLPNFVFGFLFLYFGIIVEGEEWFTFRQIIYFILIILDLIGILYINWEFIYIRILAFKRKEKINEDNHDEVKDFIEKSVRKDYPYNFPKSYIIDRQINRSEKEYEYNLSKAKLDERMISEKMNSPITYTNKKEYIEYTSNRPNLFFTDNEKIINSTEKLLKALSSKYPKKLKTSIITSNQTDIEKDINIYGLQNYGRWIQNFKGFLVNETLNNILQDHNSNIDLLNNLLGKSLNINIVHNMTDNSLENEPSMFKEINDLINSNNLNFTHKPDDFYRINDESKYKIFFADMEKLENLTHIIINRLDYLRLISNRSKSLKKENISDNQNHFSNSYIENDYRKMRMNINNPFRNKEMKYNLLSHYKDIITKQNLDIEDNLKNILQLLLYRIRLNNILMPMFIKSESRQHTQLISEYVIWRFNELKNSSLNGYKNDSGGNFKGEHWITALPTDSQLISSLFINYLDHLYKENGICTDIYINWPIVPRLEKGLNSLFLYQISNLNSEPHFNVIYEDKVINCIVGKDNFFYAAVVFLNFAKIKISTLTEKLRLDEFIAKIITD